MSHEYKSIDEMNDCEELYGEMYREWGGEYLLFSERPKESEEAEKVFHKKERVTKSQDKKERPLLRMKLGNVPFESPEIFSLIFGPIKAPRSFDKKLKALEICKNKDLEKCELTKFHLGYAKHRKIYEYLQLAGTKKKIEIYNQRILEKDLEEVPKKRGHYERLLREYAASLPTVPLQQTWIDSIVDKLHNLHLKFPVIANSIMDEVKDVFSKCMHKFGVDMIMKCLPGEEKEIHQLPIREEVGRTPRYHLYLMHREMLKSRLYILHRIQRKIFTLSVKILPEVLVDFRKYRAYGFLTLGYLESVFSAELKKSEYLVTTSLYPKVIALISRKRALSDIPSAIRPKYLASATNILVVNVNTLFYIYTYIVPR